MVKTNLMIFIKPTILRDHVATAYETNEKYTAIRNMQLAERDSGRKLIPDMQPPVMPELPQLPPTTIDLRALPAPEAAVESDDDSGEE